MTRLATSIYQRVVQAMQSADELGGHEGEDYLALMSVIETEAIPAKRPTCPPPGISPPIADLSAPAPDHHIVDTRSPIGLWCGSPVVYGGEEAPLDSYRQYQEIVNMTRRWNFRAYPTDTQAEHLTRTFGCCRLVYNGMLAARTVAFQRGERLTQAATDKRLTILKRDPELAFLNAVSCVPLQQSLRHLQQAFVNFFATRSAYPTFKKKHNTRDSATYTRSAFRFDRVSQRLTLAKLGVLDLCISRRVEVDPSTVTVTRHPSGRYYVSMVVEVPVMKRVTTGLSVGIDFGLSRLATLSNGETIPNPRHLGRKTDLLARAQRRLSRKEQGSNRRRAQARRIARLHEKIVDARRDALHKLSTSLIRRFDTICVEDLHLRGLVQNHRLARSLSDASIGTAIRMIEAKAEAAGVSVVKIDRWFPSSTQCSACGHLLDALPLSVRRWTCPRCGTDHDRDVNASRNILAVGQTVSARGAGVRTARTSVWTATRRRSVNHSRTKHRVSS